MNTKVAIIGIIVENIAASEEINSVLHGVSEYVVGRMGIPYHKREVSIISVVVDAPEDVLATTSDALEKINGVSVKITYSNL